MLFKLSLPDSFQTVKNGYIRLKKSWIKTVMWTIFLATAIFWLWIDWSSNGYVRPHRVTNGFFITMIALLFLVTVATYKVIDEINPDNIPILSSLGKLGSWGESFAKVVLVLYFLMHVTLLCLMWSDVQTTDINAMWVENDMFWLWLILHLLF